MSKWNFKLFEDFKQAAKELDIEVIPGHSYYSLKLPKKDRYAYCWTPLNKMSDLGHYEPNQALDHIKYNQDDFHLEFDTYEYSVTMVFAEMFHTNSDKNTIKAAIELLLDDQALQRRSLLADLKYSTEEYTQ
jgi:hypothetical protein